MNYDNVININSANFGNEIKQTINARDLHDLLGSKQDFSTWIKSRLEDYLENIDFVRFHKKMEATNR